MLNSILKSFDIWSTAQVQKSMGRNRGINNIKLHGIDRLREIILELAVQGKLVPQNPEDEPGSIVLKNIYNEQKRLIEEVGLKTFAKGEIDFSEEYINKPIGWIYCRLGNLAKFIDYRGRTPKKIEKGIPLITAKNVRFGYISEEPKEYISENDYEKWMTRGIPKINDILFTTEAPLGNAAIVNLQYKFALAQRVICFQLHEPSISNFLRVLLISPTFQNELLEKATGMTATGIKASKLKQIPIPLPPLAEQHRIVAKVDELMALCDKLEEQQSGSNKIHHLLVETLLKSLSEASNANELQTAWQRVERNFDTLFTTEESIDLLKQTILQLAVMGKLVPQSRNDEPASVLLKKIASEKKKLIAEGKIKKQNSLPEITEDEKPFDLPEGWEFAKMDKICNLVTDGTHLTPKYTENGRVFISAQNIKPFKFIPEKHRWVSEEDYQGFIQNRKPEKGDILLTRVGAGIGEAAVIDTDLEFAIYVSAGLLKFNKEYISPDYLAIWLNSPLGRTHSEKNTYGKGVSQGNLNLGLIRNFSVSIPPFNEQHRIVSKVDELFTICEQLKERIIASQEIKVKLADAVVGQAVKDKPKGKAIYPINEQFSIAAEL